MMNTAKAIIYGTLVAGTLDAINGVIFNFFAHNMTPLQVLQYIASGFYGAESFNMGLTSAAVGAVAHYFIALVLMVIYLVATRASSTLQRVPEVFGPIYGSAVFVTMNFVVLPLTHVVRVPMTEAFIVNGLVGHALLVGLPIAIYASRAARYSFPGHGAVPVKQLTVLK